MTVACSFSGCRSLKARMKRAVVVANIVKLEIAMACLVSKEKKAITHGMAIPPPPMPAMFDKHIMREKTRMPAYSRGSTGNTVLCAHMPPLPFLS